MLSARRGLASLVLGATLAYSPVWAQEPATASLEERLTAERISEKEKRATLLSPIAYLSYETGRWTNEQGNLVIKSANGTAVVIASIPKDPDKADAPYNTYALTVYHNVDVLKEGSKVSLDFFDPETRKKTEHVEATIKKKDSVTRVVLLHFESKKRCPTASLISRDDILSLNIFREIYAVGCQYARPPYATKGEIAGTNAEDDEKFDAEKYSLWSTTAIIAEGMSGGAIYTADDKTLIGLVEAYEGEPTAVWEQMKDGRIPKQIGTVTLRRPQSNLFVSPRAIYTFLRKNGYETLLQK